MGIKYLHECLIICGTLWYRAYAYGSHMICTSPIHLNSYISSEERMNFPTVRRTIIEIKKNDIGMKSFYILVYNTFDLLHISHYQQEPDAIVSSKLRRYRRG